MTNQEIDKLEAGPELDAIIAEKVMGLPFRKPTHGWCCTCQKCGYDKDHFPGCDYSSDISAAWEVVEKLTNLDFVSQLELFRDRDGKAINYYVSFLGGPAAGGSTAPLAICRAALKTIRDKEKGL